MYLNLKLIVYMIIILKISNSVKNYLTKKEIIYWKCFMHAHFHVVKFSLIMSK